MKRLTIAIDTILPLHHALQLPELHPVRYGLLCETFGADGLSVSLFPGENNIRQSDLQNLKNLRQSYLNIRLPLNSSLHKTVLAVAPDMVTFGSSASSPASIAPLNIQEITETLPDVLPDFVANNISVAVFITPEIQVLKPLSKLEIDYVELDCQELVQANDTNDHIMALDKLRTVILGAAKLGFGINCSGNLEYSHLAYLANLPHLEDVIVGRTILREAFVHGLPQAIQKAKQYLTPQVPSGR